MGHHTRLRRLTLDDYERWMAVWREAGLHSVRPNGRDSREAFSAQFASGTHIMIGLEEDEKLVGVVLATHDGRKGWINRLAVLPQRRRLGHAVLLVHEAEKVLHEHGIAIVAVLIEPDNEPSLGLFRKLGYEEGVGIRYLRKKESPDV